MSHNVETMAYTGEVPWHGLGKFKAGGWKNVSSLLKDAGLDWTVSRRPMFYGTDEFKSKVETAPQKTTISKDRYVEDFAALVRDSDGAVLDVVGSRYAPRQNAALFEFFTELVEAGKAKLDTAGSLRGGRIVWGLANLDMEFTLPGRDKVKAYLLLSSFHTQGKANVYKLTATRVVCNNTLTMALQGSGAYFKDYHSTQFNADTIKRAKEALGLGREQFAEFEKTAIKLQKMKLKRPDIIGILAPIYQPDAVVDGITNGPLLREEAPFDKNLAIVMDVLVKAPGAQPDTGWGVLNAVTYYADHVASRTPDKRLTNAWFGKTEHQKEAVLEALLKR